MVISLSLWWQASGEVAVAKQIHEDSKGSSLDISMSRPLIKPAAIWSEWILVLVKTDGFCLNCLFSFSYEKFPISLTRICVAVTQHGLITSVLGEPASQMFRTQGPASLPPGQGRSFTGIIQRKTRPFE